jgi:hypothetical protein
MPHSCIGRLDDFLNAAASEAGGGRSGPVRTGKAHRGPPPPSLSLRRPTQTRQSTNSGAAKLQRPLALASPHFNKRPQLRMPSSPIAAATVPQILAVSRCGLTDRGVRNVSWDDISPPVKGCPAEGEWHAAHRNCILAGCQGGNIYPTAYGLRLGWLLPELITSMCHCAPWAARMKHSYSSWKVEFQR